MIGEGRSSMPSWTKMSVTVREVLQEGSFVAYKGGETKINIFSDLHLLVELNGVKEPVVKHWLSG